MWIAPLVRKKAQFPFFSSALLLPAPRKPPGPASPPESLHAHQLARLVAHEQLAHPGEDGDVGNRVFLAHDPVAALQVLVQYAGHTARNDTWVTERLWPIGS